MTEAKKNEWAIAARNSLRRNPDPAAIEVGQASGPEFELPIEYVFNGVAIPSSTVFGTDASAQRR